MLPESLLTGENASFVDVLYQQWLQAPAGVDPEWAAWFEGFDRPANGVVPGSEPRFRPRSIFNAGGGAGAGASGLDEGAVREAVSRQVKTNQLINAWRVRGHLEAGIDPLGSRAAVAHPELTLAYWGLSDSDLDKSVLSAPLFGLPPVVTLREVLAHLRTVYATTIAAEFMNIDDIDQKRWVAEQLETLPHKEVLNAQEERRVLRKLSDAEGFERMLHTRFPGTKRFSLEGAETLIPLLDLLVEHAAIHGAKELVFGMAHRGRLNTLANILEKPVSVIVEEFEGTKGTVVGSGDVKYHLGYSSDVLTQRGDRVHVNLCFNPSHLEAVDPVLLGRVRAKMDRAGDSQGAQVVPVMIHGDAAFAGQGVVMEVLQGSELPGYQCGGTVHIIVNNQIGFTTSPDEARSTDYASGPARMLGVPIFHVNGEDPRACAAAIRIATEWRARFHRDVVIDMYCYRKHGHNEGDEPSFTQPILYDRIRRLPTPREAYARRLVQAGHMTDQEAARILEESQAAIQRQLDPVNRRAGGEASAIADVVKPSAGPSMFEKDTSLAHPAPVQNGAGKQSPLKGLWSRFHGTIHDETDTRVPLERLTAVLHRANTLPSTFTAHAKIKRLLAQRDEMIRGERPVDWSIGELAAFATLADQGVGVRLTGQDCVRGTFSHRHAGFTDVRTGDEHLPLQHLSENQAPVHIFNSYLSEFAVLGFEFGYSLDAPDRLVLWEAQFGDFANGAQVIIDQFISSAEQKWNRYSGLVMLLPHGYSGQGPEHSSARLERFLQLCGDDNLQVANPTTPAQIYHLLRRQSVRSVRKPLVIMSPKDLLRHPLAVSSISELAEGHFQTVIDEADDLPASGVRRVVLCNGKLYYELLEARRAREIRDVALVRVELLHPFPAEAIRAVVDRYPAGVELVWAQEEPRNMGAWPMYLDWFTQSLPNRYWPRYVGRPAAASPATGSHHQHVVEQARVIDGALAPA